MKLGHYLTQREISHAEFAAQIRVSQASVTRYVGGRRIPKPQIVARIEAKTGGAVKWQDHFAAHTEYLHSISETSEFGSGPSGTGEQQAAKLAALPDSGRQGLGPNTQT